MFRSLFLLLTSTLFFCAHSHAQFQAPGRSILEPPNGKVIYGMGQDSIVLGNAPYVTAGELTQVHEGIVQIASATGATPMFTHFYVGEYTGNALGWTFENRMNLLSQYNSTYSHNYAGMFSFKFQTTTDIDKLLSGVYDTAIRSIGQQAAAQPNRPFFFRPFYEFNQYGDSSQLWIDYAALNPSKTKEQWFVAAWTKFRELVLQGGNAGNVAFVWCLLAANTSDFIAFYPGDALVDWVGIDIFSSGHLTNAAGPILSWVRTATDKPIILPEVQPGLGSGRGRPYTGTQEKQAAVDNFFNPLFNMIETNPEVKGLIYMNFWFKKLYTDDPITYSWVVGAGLDAWGDGRVQPTSEAAFSPIVFNFFSSKIGNASKYLYEGQFASLDDPDSPPPPPSLTDYWVQDIALTVNVTGTKYQGVAVVTLIDGNGSPVANATVQGAWSGGAVGTVSGATATNGKVTLFSPKVSGSGTMTFTVSNITHATRVYKPASNLESVVSINY
jgi:hypothetical protein